MKIRKLGETPDSASFEIRSSQVSYRGLLRCVRRIPEVMITQRSSLSNRGITVVRYKNAVVNLEVPFADYIISSESSRQDFIEFIEKLRTQEVRWWERMF